MEQYIISSNSNNTTINARIVDLIKLDGSEINFYLYEEKEHNMCRVQSWDYDSPHASWLDKQRIESDYLRTR